MKNTMKIAILSIAMIMILASTAKVTYAFFTATVTGNDSATVTTVTTGTMKISYVDSAAITKSNWLPGDSLTKTFSVENTGNLATTYSIGLASIVSTLGDASDFVYTLASSDGGKVITTETGVPTTDATIVSDYALAVGATHNYTLTIKFKNLSEAQDDNQGKSWSAKVAISG